MTTLPFDEHRPYLMRLAYRLLGTVADAEDATQETFIRWQTAGAPELVSPRAWLAGWVRIPTTPGRCCSWS